MVQATSLKSGFHYTKIENLIHTDLEQNPALPLNGRFAMDFTSGPGLGAWMSVTHSLYCIYSITSSQDSRQPMN